MTMSKWQPYNFGRSIGARSEGGEVVQDEEHPLGARITIKQGHEYIAVSCNISGKIDHTRFFKDMETANREYAIMKEELVKVVAAIGKATMADIKMWEAISSFVARFP